jgi:hypothetical protein
MKNINLDQELKEMDLSDMHRDPYQGKVRKVTFEADSHMVNVDLSNLTLNIFNGGREVYYIDLERCLSSAQVLDWICQISGKTWAIPALLGLIVKVLDACLYPQANLCSCGIDKTISSENLKRIIQSRMREAIAWADSYGREGIMITWK